MRVGIIQSCYMPWRGYFDFIASVDVFVVLDDAQCSGGSTWRNRNRIKTSRGSQWLTVPIGHAFGKCIDDVKIGVPPKPWVPNHRRMLIESMASAPYGKEAIAIWQDGVGEAPRFLSEMNVRLIRTICEYLCIRTPIVLSRKLSPRGGKSERLIDIIRKLGGDVYLSGPSADTYLNKQSFLDSGIALEYKSYEYPDYPQLWGKFDGGVTVLDLIANCGPSSTDYLRSRVPNVRIV